MLELNDSDILLRSEEHVSCDLHGETIVMSIKKSMYYSMNKIGGVMWEMLSQPLTFSQLTQTLLKRFNVNEAQCKNDISEFLNGLHEQGLLHVFHKE